MAKRAGRHPDSRGRCVFCGAAEVSREHVFPRWLSALIPGSGSMTHRRVYDPEGEEQVPSDTWDAAEFDAVVKCVCRNCNHGWMSNLEVAAQGVLSPLVEGEPSVLDEDAQKTAATWAVKTAMMFQHNRPQSWAVPLADHHWLFEHREPPTSTKVWLGCYATLGWAAFARQASLRLTPESATRDVHDLNAYATTFAVGHLVMQVFGTARAEELTIESPGWVASAVDQIWPTLGTLGWPRAIRFGDSGLEALSKVFGPA
jgi:hypothetical protein